MKERKADRIYVCHTYYHVYISFLKEFALPKEQRGRADLVLSTMSNNFENLKDRVEPTGIFQKIFLFEEKRENFFPSLDKWRREGKNLVGNLLRRVVFTKKFGGLQEKYVPVDFRQYRDVYVYCDSDPIGYYLNLRHIPYHGIEDGLNCLKNYDSARYDNRGHFGLKAFLSKKLNWIFVQNGYGKYCLDMEVNDISLIALPCPYYVEQPRQALVDRLTEDEKELLLQAFIRDWDSLKVRLAEGDQTRDKIMILTDPLCTLDIRERIFRDIIQMYEPEGKIFLKPHPRDELDYRKLFSEYPQFDATVPMEMFNFIPGLRFRKVVGVLTELNGIHFAEETVRLGEDFMDRYEEPSVHRQNEAI
jgi:hypothetical protein